MTLKKTGNAASPVDVRITDAVSLLDEVIATLALAPLPALTAQQRKQATRARKGSEKVVPTLSTLSVKYGVNLPLQPTADMSSNAELAAQLDPLQKKLTALLTLVTATATNARSHSWATATTLYSLLKRIAVRDLELKNQLDPVQQFFAYRHPSVRAGHPKQKSKKAALAAKKQQGAAASPEPVVVAPAPVAASSNGSTDASHANAGNGAAATGAVAHA